MTKKLYIGGLAYSVNDSQLSDLFTDYGTINSATVIKDRDSGQSKGFGFVELADDAAATKAINDLNGKEFNGRALTVNEARPQEDRRPSSGGGGYRR
jgi:cold-inducible RNA-binding protein